jgi:TonB family protein
MTAAKPRVQRNASQCRNAAAVHFDAVPYNFRTFAVPAAAANSSEATNYQFVVGGMLERAKHYPEGAIRRGAKGTARIGFVLDELGGVASVSLLRSSGDADLDSESVALVRRASPFPPPPPEVKRSFVIEVAFGIKK